MKAHAGPFLVQKGPLLTPPHPPLLTSWEDGNGPKLLQTNLVYFQGLGASNQCPNKHIYGRDNPNSERKGSKIDFVLCRVIMGGYWPAMYLLSMPVGNQVVCWVWSLLDNWKAVIHNSNTFKDVCERNQPLHESKTYDSNSRKWEKQGKNYHSTLGKYNVLDWVIVDIPRSSALGEREIPAQSGRWRQSAQLVNEIDKQIICLGGGEEEGDWL